MNNSSSPSNNTVEKFVNDLEKKGLIKSLALSDEDIADTLWLALRMRVVEEESVETTGKGTDENKGQKIREDRTIKPPETTPRDNVYIYKTKNVPKKGIKPKNDALPFQTPAAPALPNKLEISRALRPLMRKVPSPTRSILDVEATVTRIAEQDIWLPVTKPELERWLDLELIVEENKSSFIWQETIAELEGLLHNHGAFRRFRTWTLHLSKNRNSSDKNELQLNRRKKRNQITNSGHSYRELISSNGRSLIILISDCVSSIWQQKTIYDWLRNWSDKVPTTIIQLFPERLWLSTKLDLGYKVQFSALNPGVPNSKLICWEDLGTKQILNLPIITLEAESFKYWAKVIAGYGSIQTPGIALDIEFVKQQLNSETHVQNSSAEISAEISVEIIVDQFLATASPTAQLLAGLMSAAPVSLPVVHLIQKTLLNKSTSVHVAEVFLSGMIERKEDEYDFVQGVRKLLNQAMPIGETEKVLDKISEYIAQNLGYDIKTFTAFLRNPPQIPEEQETIFLPFARIAVEVLSNLGGKYTDFVKDIEKNTQPVVGSEEFSFKVRTIILIDDSINPQTFDFEVALIEINQSSTSSSNLTINRYPQQATGFIQDLANDTQLEMMLIPGDTFIMGSPPEELEDQKNESPQHSVTVQPFFMGKYPITQAQWRFVAQLPQMNKELDPDPSNFKGDNRPVEQVSWEDAVEFCLRLSQYTGRTYSLPSEAQWEYACRAGTTTPFHFGKTITTDLANYDGNYAYGQGPKGVDRGETTAVGSFGVANNFGLYDMHGNVYEWCQDHWHSNYEGAPTDGSAWLSNKEDSNRRLLRGGSWDGLPVNCRSAYRYGSYLVSNNDGIGFRVVCSGAART
ncbi:formylglycine-generating enzyme family protein [Anabaena sp. FACHB-1391]|uniref:SAV_2336 N-terminal domain-related protein n=1 Tax=Anabaena sp. FACHB-1391 TaxID=2692771 RepID=UPI001680859E|nr:formylglycine-generating enzyme family protein [Anabaena sp. FACHB-1391]